MTEFERLGLSGQPESFMLLDGARDRRVTVELASSGLAFESLYDGDRGHALRDVAPYLVALGDDPSAAQSLIAGIQTEAWGVLLEADTDLAGTRKHLRRFLKVRVEGHKRPVYFRFYDPRVLRDFLPTCNAAQLGEFFGPIRRFVAVNEHERTLVAYSLESARLNCRVLSSTQSS